MVRSTLAPGPYEGQRVLDRNGLEIGTVRELIVAGHHIASFLVETRGGDRVEIPRDRFLETTRGGLQVMCDRSEFAEAVRE